MGTFSTPRRSPPLGQERCRKCRKCRKDVKAEMGVFLHFLHFLHPGSALSTPAGVCSSRPVTVTRQVAGRARLGWCLREVKRSGRGLVIRD
jgi:hypothetical protein